MSNEQLFQERQERINKAINYEPVDRMPLIFMGTAALPRQIGMTLADYVFHPENFIDPALDYVDGLGADGFNVPPWFRPDAGLTPLWLSHVKMPGRELPDDMLWQVEEKEIMTVEDYDMIINQGFEAFMFQHLPKVIGMQVFQEGMAQTEEFNPIMGRKIFERGLVTMVGGTTTIPFEFLCGARSMMPFFMDLYRTPDKVMEALEVMVPVCIGLALEMVKASGIRRVWVGGWRSASALLAPKLWDRFVFPHFQRIVTAPAEQDIISVLHLDQDWGRDLEKLRELPAKKCVLNLDGMTDLRKVKKVMDGHMAVLGDVPADILSTGTPESVDNYVKELINDIGTDGLLLCPGCDAPVNSKGENLAAMFEAGRKYGWKS